jgi:hypothetical protein
LGVAPDHPQLPGSWSVSEDDSENIRWTRDIPGRGWSSPIVWGNRVFLTTVVSEGKLEAAKKGLYLLG